MKKIRQGVPSPMNFGSDRFSLSGMPNICDYLNLLFFDETYLIKIEHFHWVLHA